jgi:hypothetical protein
MISTNESTHLTRFAAGTQFRGQNKFGMFDHGIFRPALPEDAWMTEARQQLNESCN